LSKPLIELINCESGDWKVLRINSGKDFKKEGHSISNHNWIDLLKYLGFDVEVKYVTEEEMENENY
jgi:hypothetical protein